MQTYTHLLCKLIVGPSFPTCLPFCVLHRLRHMAINVLLVEVVNHVRVSTNTKHLPSLPNMLCSSRHITLWRTVFAFLTLTIFWIYSLYFCYSIRTAAKSSKENNLRVSESGDAHKSHAYKKIPLPKNRRNIKHTNRNEKTLANARGLQRFVCFVPQGSSGCGRIWMTPLWWYSKEWLHRVADTILFLSLGRSAIVS